MARQRDRRYCVWCPREVKGLFEAFLDGRWKPVCTVCYRARHKNVYWREPEDALPGAFDELGQCSLNFKAPSH